MSDWKYNCDLNPDHYQFRRRIDGFYPDDSDTYADKVADRVIVIVCVLVIALIVAGALR